MLIGVISFKYVCIERLAVIERASRVLAAQAATVGRWLYLWPSFETCNFLGQARIINVDIYRDW